MKVNLYCTCGDACVGECDPKTYKKFKAIWDHVHHGAGHRQCDAETARKAIDCIEEISSDALKGEVE